MRKSGKLLSDVPLSEDFYKYMLDPFLATVLAERTKKEYRRQILTVCGFFYNMRGVRYSFEQLTADDAKYYFLTYLTGECSKGNLSSDTYRLRLASCKNFARYLEQRVPSLSLIDGYEGITSYTSSFSALYSRVKPTLVDTSDILSDAEVTQALSLAYDYNRALFCIFALSFRMYLPQSIILSLKKDQFNFIDDNGHTICLLTYIEKNKQVFKRIPADLTSIMREYVAGCDSYLFLNQRRNPMTADNLSRLLDRFQKSTGCRIRIGQLRSKGIVDLISHNKEDLDEVGDFTGLSKKMLEGYGQAADRIENSCIADNSGYCISIHKERS